MKTKEQKNENTKGITLIALVITIIILIILAGVTINLTLGENGIFSKAEQAKENYMVVANEEKEAVSNVEESIDELIGESGQKVNPDLAKLKVGDYIKYDTGVTSVGTNGVITCRVLYEASSQYGLQIISDKNVGTNITLGGDEWETGKISHNSAIETLNNETEKYLNKEYAHDARSVGSLPTIDSRGMFTQKDKGTTTTVTLPPAVPEGEDEYDWWTDYTRPSGWESDDTGCFNTDKNYETDQIQMINANIWTTEESYWLASRDVYLDSSSCFLDVRVLHKKAGLIAMGMCVVYSNGRTMGISNTNGIRSCFSLRSDIKITGGDGKSEATAYTM